MTDTTDYSDKESYTEALQAEELRKQITVHASGAVKHGSVDRDWANGWLIRLGAQPVTGSAQYKINVPITGVYGTTVTANSRAEALEKFSQYAQAVVAAGQLRDSRHCGEGVYGLTLTGQPDFYSGPADPPESDGAVPGLDGTKDGIFKMIREGVAEQGWGYSYAANALQAMGLPTLPDLEYHTVTVPVTGTTRISVAVFEGDGDEAIQRAATRLLAATPSFSVQADEVGEVVVERGDMSVTLVDEPDEPTY